MNPSQSVIHLSASYTHQISTPERPAGINGRKWKKMKEQHARETQARQTTSNLAFLANEAERPKILQQKSALSHRKWIVGQCNSDVNSEMCKKAEGIFQKAIKNNFVPDYQDEFWRLIALNKVFDCTAYKEVIDPDCNYKGGHWEYLCSSEYQPNGQTDCEYKLLNWKQHCNQDLHSEACKKAEEIFQTSTLTDFKPNMKDDFWRQKSLRRVFTGFTSPIAQDYFFKKYSRWYQECNVNINSNNCKNAEQAFEHMLQFEFRKSDSQECREAKAKITKQSTLDAVKRAYRKKTLGLHPDKNPDSNGTNEAFIQLTADYEEFKKKCGVN